MFAEQEGKRGGEFFTPSCVVRTLVEVLKPFKGRVYDPCCGSGGMFVQSAKFVENHSGNISNISIYGQDSNPTTWKMAQMNLAIRGIEPDLGTYAADTFLDDRHPTLRADYIMANPPFNLSDWGLDKLKEDAAMEIRNTTSRKCQLCMASAYDFPSCTSRPYWYGISKWFPFFSIRRRG